MPHVVLGIDALVGHSRKHCPGRKCVTAAGQLDDSIIVAVGVDAPIERLTQASIACICNGIGPLLLGIVGQSGEGREYGHDNDPYKEKQCDSFQYPAKAFVSHEYANPLVESLFTTANVHVRLSKCNDEGSLNGLPRLLHNHGRKQGRDAG